jgi:hypothetical protein
MILDAEPNGDYNKDLYDEDELDFHDVNHPDYMPPHVQARLIGSGIYRHYIIPKPGTPEEQDKNERFKKQPFRPNMSVK